MVDLSKKELTPSELRVLTCIAEEGLGDVEAADRLFISVKTVKNHLSNIYRRIGVYSCRGAIAYYYKNIKNKSCS